LSAAGICWSVTQNKVSLFSFLSCIDMGSKSPWDQNKSWILFLFFNCIIMGLEITMRPIKSWALFLSLLCINMGIKDCHETKAGVYWFGQELGARACTDCAKPSTHI
jgi:hypothetical protein